MTMKGTIALNDAHGFMFVDMHGCFMILCGSCAAKVLEHKKITCAQQEQLVASRTEAHAYAVFVVTSGQSCEEINALTGARLH